MKLGFLTACLPDLSLEELVTWASGHGYEALEVAVWPDSGTRPFVASHIDVASLTDSRAGEIRDLFAHHGITLSSLAFYDNNLHPDPQDRQAINAHVRTCIDAAARLGAPSVGTFIGRDPGRSVRDNLREAEVIFRPIVSHADSAGVDVVIENCVMEGWHPDGYPGNLAYSPELWEWMFGLGLYLNFDPSHLVWLGIDPVEALRPYVDRVRHAQAKDIEVFADRRNHFGFFGKAMDRVDPWDVGWWRYRVPGLGDVDWRRLVDVLHEGGFDGVLSVEHEDPVWSGSTDRVLTGLEVARRTLSPHLLETP